MKKYLMTGIAALTFSGMITSCSHDMDQYTGGDVTENIQKDYETKFVSRFGEPAPTQDWGFGSSSVAGVRGGTRTVSGITFPTFKDGDCPEMPTKYYNTVAEVEANVSYFTGDVNNKSAGDVFYIDSNSTLSNTQNRDNLTIYVIGNVTYLGSTSQNNDGTTFCVTEGSTLKLGKVCERLTIYLARNATLDISERLDENGNKARETIYPDWNNYQATTVEPTDFTFTKDNAALYMSTGSKVKGTNIYFKDDYTVLNDGGTIETEDLHVENGAVLYNKNEITATGVIALRNTNGEIDNFGTMEGASMTLDANARFYNVAGGTVNISGLTKINNNGGNNAWMNGGQFNTGSFEITGGCSDPVAFNNCHMEVDDKFYMNEGNFVLDGGAAVECGSFEWKSNNYFHMGGKALLKVTGELLANNQNTGYGFYGDDTDYAVIQAGSVTKGSESTKFAAAYFGNLFIDTNNHFTQGENSAEGTWYTFGDNVKFSFTDNTDVTGFQTTGAKTAQKAENFSINIPADNTNGCTPGYKWGTSNDEIESVRVIAEDLTVNDVKADFDFNDVVFDVNWNKTQGKVSVKVLAAGGELTLYIGGTAAGVTNVRTVNDRFAEANPDKKITEKTMINTAAGYHNEYNTFEFDLSNDEWDSNSNNINAIAKSIYVRVMKSNELTTLKAEKGKAAAKICVGTDYVWCDERQDIDAKYPSNDPEKGKFSKYVDGQGNWDNWYHNDVNND